MGSKKTRATGTQTTHTGQVETGPTGSDATTGGRAKGGPPSEPDPRAPLLELLEGKCPGRSAEVLGVEFYRRRRNARGVCVGLEPVPFDGPDGTAQKRLDTWLEVGIDDLAELFGGGDFKVCCRGASQIVTWLDVTLPGPERSASPEAAASADPDGPGSVRSVASAGGLVLSDEDLPRGFKPFWLLLQQVQNADRERFLIEAQRARSEADARVRMMEAFCRTVVELNDKRVAEAHSYAEQLSKALAGFTALQVEIATSSATASGAVGPELLKVLAEERKTAAEQRLKADKAAEELHREQLAKKHKGGAVEVLRELAKIAPHGRDAVRGFVEAWSKLGQEDGAAGIAAEAVADAAENLGPK